ncbi:MAG: hypothetical protein IT330_19730, partial [Anaerolineae bacterium]|nr:hypothetical protein [Anaerolineae bacterium]
MDVILASDARYLNTAPVLDELMQDSLNILLPTSAAAVWGWTVVSVFVMDLALPRAYLIFFLSLLTIWAGDRLRQRYLNLAVGIYLAGLALVVTILAISFSDAAVLYLYMLVVLITAMLTGPRATGVATIVSAALVLTIGQRVHQMPFSGVVLPLLLIVLTALTTWLSAQRLFTALAWSLTMTREAQKHADEAQKNRGEIARILKSLDEAYVRLERAHEGLIFAREAAEKAYRFKTEFVTSVSHELRTPLNLIVGFSEMMATAPESYGGVLLPSQYRGDVMAIYSSAKHLRDLINDVLDLSRIEGGRLPLSKEPADLAEVVHEAAGMVRGLAESRGLRLDVGLSSRLPMLRLDRTRIRQVLLNLLTNAIRFTDAGWIRVRVGKEGTEAVVVVQDSGRGISPEGLARAFEAFSQLEEDRERQGSGLGLAVSKKFVELHGGRMWIESE